MNKYNDRLERVQVNRYKEVPIEEDNSIWVLWINKNNKWDSDTIANWKSYINEFKQAELIFCVWHGKYRTNLFLMDKNNIIKRLSKLC